LEKIERSADHASGELNNTTYELFVAALLCPVWILLLSVYLLVDNLRGRCGAELQGHAAKAVEAKPDTVL
jgi:hypothetical protein